MDNPRRSRYSPSARNSEDTVIYLTSIFGPILDRHPEQWMLQNQLALNMAIRSAYDQRSRASSGYQAPIDPSSILSKKYLQRLRDRGRLTLLKNVHKYGERSQDHDLLKEEIKDLMIINEHRVDSLLNRVFVTQREVLRDMTAANMISESVNHFIPYAWVNLEDGSERWGPIPDFIQVKNELATNGVTKVVVMSLWLNIDMARIWGGDWDISDHMSLADMHNTGGYTIGISDIEFRFTPVMKSMIKSMLKLSMVRMKKAIEKRARTKDRGGGSDSEDEDSSYHFMN